MGCSLLDCAKCCSIFSVSGFFFLIIIGYLLHKQPLYIKGAEDPHVASQGCYSGALIYLGFAIVSIAYWVIHNMTTATANKIAQIRETATQKKSGKTSKKKSKKFEGGNYGAVEDEL